MQKHLFAIFFLLLFGGSTFAQSDSLVQFEVYFDLDQSRLTKIQKIKVDSILQKAPISIISQIKIYGHTDSLAGVEYNRDLSKRRVLSILQYFVGKGLDPLKAKTDFYGEERPKYDNGPDERFRNRRCEVVLYIDASLLPQPEQKLSDLEVKKGDKLRIPNLNFVGNQPIPVFESIPALEDLVLLMQRNPDLVVEVQGHVCCANDQELSDARAFTVYQFLVANGIAKERMRHRGFSNTKPLFKEIDENAKALNRRVDLEVISNSDKRIQVLDGAKPIVDLRAPVLNIKYFDESARLMPSGDFMLTLVTDAIKQSEGVRYNFFVYDNINDPNLTKQRADALEKIIRRKGVDVSKVKVTQQEGRKSTRFEEKNNYIEVQIRSI